jgi:hypothetical protein
MRINFFFILISTLALPACKEKGTTPASSYIHSLADSLDIDRSKNILLYTINPNDCISCINGFRSMNSDICEDGNGKIIVISVGRAVEKAELSKKITDIDLHSQKNRQVLWGKELFDGINRTGNITLALSSVFVYNFTKDTLLFARPIREVSDDNEIRKALAVKL